MVLFNGKKQSSYFDNGCCKNTLFSNGFHQDHSVTIGLIFNLVDIIILITLQERNAYLFKGTKQTNVKDCIQDVS